MYLDALLEQIRDPNNLKRLKKVTPPVEKKVGVGRVKGAKEDDNQNNEQPQQPVKADAGKTLSHVNTCFLTVFNILFCISWRC